MVSIYNYTNYRLFLQDVFQEKKNLDPKFSHRYFALKLGVKSTGFIADVLSERRNLNQKHIALFSKALGLNKDEDFYFENMVRLNQAETLEEKNKYFKRLTQSKKVNMQLINKERFEFYSQWYHSAIREMLYFFPYDGNVRHLAKSLIPSVTEEQARHSVELLQRLHFIQWENAQNKFVLTDGAITTGAEVRSLEVANFQMETMDIAKKALNQIPAEERDISTLTLSLSDTGYDKIKEILQNTRKEILKTAREDAAENKVYQVNMQFFPLSKKIEHSVN